MSNRRKFAADSESILMALDQLSQTMEVMGQVVSRLKRSVEQAQIAEQALQDWSNTEIPSAQASQVINQNAGNKSSTEKQFIVDETNQRSIVLH